jgi:hypothetical protein
MELKSQVITSVDQIPSNGYMVYYLKFDGKCIVCGHGKKGRARIIFDDINVATKHHIKSLLVRVYRKYGGYGLWSSHIIPCTSKAEAAHFEKEFHKHHGGNSNEIPPAIYQELTTGLTDVQKMILDMAICSAFSGLHDLQKWRAKKIIDDVNWKEITNRLGTW